MDPSSQPRIIADYQAKLTACMLGSFRIRWAAPEGIWSSPKMVARKDASGLLGAETIRQGLKRASLSARVQSRRQFQARHSGRPLNGKAGPYGVDVLREIPWIDVFSQVALGPRPLQSLTDGLFAGLSPLDHRKKWYSCSRVVRVVQDYSLWLARSRVPKLYFREEPGALDAGNAREFCRQWPNQKEIAIKGIHYVQEDSAHEIGVALADFVRGLRKHTAVRAGAL